MDFGEIELFGHPVGIMDYKFNDEIDDSIENSNISDDEEFSPNRANSRICCCLFQINFCINLYFNLKYIWLHFL